MAKYAGLLRKKVNTVSTVDDDPDDEYVFSTYDNTAQNKPRATVCIAG